MPGEEGRRGGAKMATGDHIHLSIITRCHRPLISFVVAFPCSLLCPFQCSHTLSSLEHAPLSRLYQYR